VLITGVGTGGHITGCARVLKARWPQLKVFCGRAGGIARHLRRAASLRPTPSRASARASSPTTSTPALLDGVIQVDAEPAREMARRCAREEGLLVGHLLGAPTLAAIAQKLPELAANAVVLGFNYDTGERYLSIEGFLPA
jgi:cysteine synthase A